MFTFFLSCSPFLFLEDLSCVKAWLNDFSQGRIGDSDLGIMNQIFRLFLLFFLCRDYPKIRSYFMDMSRDIYGPYINWQQPFQIWNSLLSTRIIAYIINHRQCRLLHTNQNISHQPDKHVNFILTTFFPSCWILLLAIILDGFHSHHHCFYSRTAHTLGFISWMIFLALLVLQYNCFIIPQILIHRFQFLFVICVMTFLTSVFTPPPYTQLFFIFIFSFFCSHFFFMLFILLPKQC